LKNICEIAAQIIEDHKIGRKIKNILKDCIISFWFF